MNFFNKTSILFFLSVVCSLSAQTTAQSKQPIDLYICIGQSNMAGRAPLSAEVMDTLHNVLLLNNEGQFEKAVNPLNKYSNIRKDMSMQGVGPTYAFAKAIAQKSKAPIALVVNARGGSSINSWLKDSKDGYYEQSLLRIRQAIDNGGVVKAIIWHQGEADCKYPESYKKKLASMVNDLRTDLNCPDVPFIVGEISRWNWTKREEGTVPFNKMIRNVSSFIPNTDCVSSKGCNMRKDVTDPHFGLEGQIKLGERYAKKALKMMKKE